MSPTAHAFTQALTRMLAHPDGIPALSIGKRLAGDLAAQRLTRVVLSRSKPTRKTRGRPIALLVLTDEGVATARLLTRVAT